MAQINNDDVRDYGATPVEELQFLYVGGYSTHFALQTSVALRNLDMFADGRVCELVSQGFVRCLADLLLVWLTYDDATRVCPTFDLYLSTVIQVIGVWAGDEAAGLLRIDSVPQRVPTDERMHDRWSADGIYRMSTLVRPGSEANLFAHPAFDRGTYEMARVERSLPGWKEESFL